MKGLYCTAQRASRGSRVGETDPGWTGTRRGSDQCAVSERARAKMQLGLSVLTGQGIMQDLAD